MVRARIPHGVWLFALGLALVTSLPYGMAALNTPPGSVYSGMPALPTGIRWDYNSHLAKMWQGARGEWAYHLLFTHEAHRGIPLVQGFYVALGALAHLLTLSLPAAFHAARFALTAGMVLALWVFAASLFADAAERWLCLLMATLVGGWSWLLLLLAPGMTRSVSPIEFWLVDAYNLLGALLVPHFAAAIILQVAAVLVFEAWVRRGGARRLAVLAALLAAVSLIQPYSILLLGSLLALATTYHLVVTRCLTLRRALGLALPGGVYVGLTLYQYAAMRSDPVWQNFVAQNQTRSPAPVYYLLGYLPLLLPAALGLRQIVTVDLRRDPRWLIPLLWVGLVILLIYLPLPTQRRYLLGVQTPLAALAALGWQRGILPRVTVRRRALLTIVYLTFASISSLLILLASAAAMLRSVPQETLYTADESAGFDWLRRYAAPGDVVLTVADESDFGSGGRLVAALGQRVFIGHWIETTHFADKVQQVRQFYDPATPDAWRRRFLADIGAAYVWYDDDARHAGAWNPGGADYLRQVFRSGGVTIFQVEPQAGG